MKKNTVNIIFMVILIMALTFSMSACGSGSTYEEGKDVYQLKGIQRYGHFIEAYAVDDTRALLRYGSLSQEGGPDNWMYIQYMALYDVAKDEMIKEIQTEGVNEETILGIRENGDIVTWDMYGSEVFFYTKDLGFDHKISLPVDEDYIYLSEPGMTYDRERDCLYYSSYNKIYEISIDGDASEMASFGNKTAVRAYDPVSGRAVVERNKKKSFTGRVYTVYDTSDGSALKTLPSAESYSFLDGDLMTVSYRVMPNTDDKGFSDHCIMNLYGDDISQGTALDLGKECRIRGNGGSFCFADKYIDESTMVPLFIDKSTNKAAVPDLGAENIYGFTGCLMGESGRCLAACDSVLDLSEDPSADEVAQMAAESGLGRINLYVIDPSLLEYEETFEEVQADSTRALKAQKKANLKLVRAFADELEDEYHVDICYGDEAVRNDLDESYVMESTDSYKGDNSQQIYGAIEQIRKAIVQYPEGFFDHFREKGGKGVCFRLVDSMHSKENSFNYAGLSYPYYDDFYIDLDIRQLAGDNVLVHHELWHTVEECIFDRDPYAFDLEKWQAMNPPGFDYVYDLDKYDDEGRAWDKYILDDGKDPYFIKTYSMVNSQEDRATLMEPLFDGFHGSSPAETYETLKKYPHLKAKYKYMAARVKEEFGYVYWKKMN